MRQFGASRTCTIDKNTNISYYIEHNIVFNNKDIWQREQYFVQNKITFFEEGSIKNYLRSFRKFKVFRKAKT